jgi:hypothetical protein
MMSHRPTHSARRPNISEQSKSGWAERGKIQGKKSFRHFVICSYVNEPSSYFCSYMIPPLLFVSGVQNYGFSAWSIKSFIPVFMGVAELLPQPFLILCCHFSVSSSNVIYL